MIASRRSSRSPSRGSSLSLPRRSSLSLSLDASSSMGEQSAEAHDNPSKVGAVGFIDNWMSDGPSQTVIDAWKRAEAAGDAFGYGMRREATNEERIAAARHLANWMNSAYGPEAKAIGHYMRESHQIALVLSLLYVGEVQLHRYGLMVLANLVSDTFDVRSHETKTLVVNASIFERLKDFLYAGDSVSRLMATACLQNLCTDVRYAQMLQSYELTDELDLMVKNSNDPNLRRFAAGALGNALEALMTAFNSRDARSNGVPTQEAETTTDVRRPRRLSLTRAASGMLQQLAVADNAVESVEFELSDEVLEEIHAREVDFAEVRRKEEEAAGMIQTCVKRRKAARAMRTLLHMVKAVKIVLRWQQSWRHRRRRRSALTLQAHARAYICHSRRICSYEVVLCIIYSTRSASARAISRMVHKQIAKIEAARIEAKYQVTGSSIAAALAAREARLANKDGSKLRDGANRRVLGRKALFAGRSIGREALDALQLTLPRPPTISARLPLFAPVVPGGNLKILPHGGIPIRASFMPGPVLAASPRATMPPRAARAPSAEVMDARTIPDPEFIGNPGESAHHSGSSPSPSRMLDVR